MLKHFLPDRFQLQENPFWCSWSRSFEESVRHQFLSSGNRGACRLRSESLRSATSILTRPSLGSQADWMLNLTKWLGFAPMAVRAMKLARKLGVGCGRRNGAF